jgi:hypothetical protein
MSDIDDFYFENQQPTDEKFTNRGPLLIHVKIYDKTTFDENWVLIREHTRDIRKGKNRDWLIGAMLWAVSNQKRVEIERKVQK